MLQAPNVLDYANRSTACSFILVMHSSNPRIVFDAKLSVHFTFQLRCQTTSIADVIDIYEDEQGALPILQDVQPQYDAAPPAAGSDTLTFVRGSGRPICWNRSYAAALHSLSGSLAMLLPARLNFDIHFSTCLGTKKTK